MEHNYNIEALASTFADHAGMSDAHQQQINAMFKESNPGQDLPEHMANPFNVARALSVMAAEIEKLKIRCD